MADQLDNQPLKIRTATHGGIFGMSSPNRLLVTCQCIGPYRGLQL